MNIIQKEEWNEIEKLAQEKDESEAVKVAKELVEMVSTAQINVQEVLEQQTKRIESSFIDDLVNTLNQYTGNNGQYTALVKMTRLYLPNDELKGFDIIDTPE